MAAPVVMTGMDGSEGGDRALGAGVEVAAPAHYGVVAVPVAHLPSVVATTAMGASTLEATADEVANRCHLACEVTFAGTACSGCSSSERRPGYRMSLAGAEHHAAWIVVGRHGHGRFARLVLGSVTDRFLQ